MAFDSTKEPNSFPLYEKEIQDYLAANLSLLGGAQLKLIQTEYPVAFGSEQGRIDILAEDAFGTVFVIEIKRGTAGRGAVGQLQSYMGSVLAEFPGRPVKGVLVAADLDGAAAAAMLVTPITFFRFTTHFEFRSVAIERPSAPIGGQGGGDYKKNYWEPLGGIVMGLTYQCSNCNKTTRIVQVGGAKLCGLCGKPAR